MNDNQLRGLVLKYFYHNRRLQRGLLPGISDLGELQNVNDRDIVRACNQLADHNLIDWQKYETFNGSGGLGNINAFGVDVIEGTAKSPISINLDNSQSISVSGSSNVTISGSNTQGNTITLEDLISQVDNNNASDKDKDEARNLFRRFLEHPLVSSIADGAISLLG
jgi:hypothetical protein